MEEYYKLTKTVLNDTEARYNEERDFWMWVFSVQFVYGLRISEIFHIRNWTEDYCPAKDPEENNPLKTVFPALVDTKKNPEHVIYIANYRERTAKDSRRKTAKTGWRYVHPIEDPECPNMFEDFEIIKGIQKHLPRLRDYRRGTFVGQANRNLRKWSKKYLDKEVRGTHILRKIASQVKYATSETKRKYENEMGHGIKVAEKNYLRRDPEVDKQIEEKAKMAKANRGELKTDIATGMKIITQAYKNVSPEAKTEVRQMVILMFRLFFGLDFDPEKEE
ncbi:MAG: hypothetical protein QXS29_10780 [Nitrososphaeria archaeon]